MKIQERKLKGVFEIELGHNSDERGYFTRTYDEKIFGEYGISKNWPQESESYSKVKGTVRGLHFQYPPDAESKAVRAVAGETFFAFVDLRKNSPTFGKWDSVILSAEKMNMIVIPRGFANGIYTLTPDCKLVYKMDNWFAPNNYDSLKWDDPDIGIEWPDKNPAAISEKDKNAKSFKQFLEERGGLEV